MTATLAADPSAAPASADSMLRFTAGARNRDDDVFYDESTALGAGSKMLPEIIVPPGNWLTDVYLIVTVTAAGNAAAVAMQGDAPWNLLETVEFTDPGGQLVSSWTGYGLMLANLLGGFDFQTDPTKSPLYTAPVAGAGHTGFRFILKVPVQVIDRDAIGAMPNGPSNTVPRVRVRLAPSASVYSVAPTNAPTVQVQALTSGWVMPSDVGMSGRPVAPQPPGSGSFQQWSELTYDFTTGTRVLRHTRTGQTYRTLILVARTAAGVRSDAVISQLGFSVDQIFNQKGPWLYHRHKTWQRQLIPAHADLPTGVVQISYAHEWDGKVGGEIRDQWIPTAPGSDVNAAITATAAGQLQVITNEIVAVAGSGVVRT